MATDTDRTKQADRAVTVKTQGGSSGTVYGLGLIGAWVYYLGRAKSFQEGVAGFFKGVVWPAFLVYGALKYLDEERPAGQ